ncbi:MAG: hypothetical protein JWM80_6405 [Cyanobacteria bacterium RYN_339]|nr:hypothetical protein [Cyanobacteria bacterium RYN_339]
MNLRDNTIDANSGENMADYYLYHFQSEQDRWALAVEQTAGNRFHVSVMVKQFGWDIHGVVRYWVFDERDMAEARLLELQGIFGGMEEGIALEDLIKKLPAAERRVPSEED